MLWIIACVLCVIAVLLVIIAVRTRLFKPLAKVNKSIYKESVDMAAPRKLAESIRIPTVSYIDTEKIDRGAFIEFQELLAKSFPLIHARCEKTIIGSWSLVYRLKSGKDEKPVLITAHMDVVPVEPGTEADWTEPPFSGAISDGMVWGRGALDTKIHLIAAMEALERLLGKGFSPSRDIYLAFGHDEEIAGRGAIEIAEYFKEQGVTFDFVLDEGGCAARNILPGIDKPIALVGVGEKGFANIRLSVTMDGGHSSMPGRHTSLGVLAQALTRLEAHPMRTRLIPPTKSFLLKIGPHMKGINRVILANLWLAKPLFMRVFSKMNAGSALLRTTMAVTMAQGSPAPNVIPQKSQAVINSRILPGETGDDLLRHIRETLGGLPVDIEALNLNNPSALSPSDAKEFRFIEDLIEEFCGDVIVAPYLVMGATDARKYEPVCSHIYRFTPYLIDQADIGKMHGTNENISVVNVNRCVDFFTALLERV